jgi:hypothetical protein
VKKRTVSIYQEERNLCTGTTGSLQKWTDHKIDAVSIFSSIYKFLINVYLNPNADIPSNITGSQKKLRPHKLLGTLQHGVGKVLWHFGNVFMESCLRMEMIVVFSIFK